MESPSPSPSPYTAQSRQAGAEKQERGWFWYRIAIEGKRRIEGGRRIAADDVRPYPQPVRIQKLIASPALQVVVKGRNSRPRTREPKKFSVCHLDLRHEKVVIGRQIEGRGKCHIE